MARRMNRLTALVAVAGLALGGCATDQQQQQQTGSVSGTARSSAPATRTAARTDGLRPTTMYFPTGQESSSVIALAVLSPPEVRLGEPYAYEVEVRNLTDAPLAGVMLREVPHGGEMGMSPGEADRRLSAEQEMRAAAGLPPAAGRQGGGPNTWEIGTLDPRQTKTVRIEAVADDVGMERHCFAVDFSPVACTAVAVVNPELRLTKAAPEAVLVCQDLVYRYSVQNVGTGTARNVRIVDRLPEGLVTAEGRNTVTLEAGDLAAGQSRDFTVTLRPSRTGEFTTQAMVMSDSAGEIRTEPVTTMIFQPELEVVVQGPEWEYHGKPVQYEVQVTNRSEVPASNVVVSLEGASLQPAQGEGGGMRRELGTIPPGETRGFVVQALAGAPAAPGADDGPPQQVRLTATATAECARPVTQAAATEIRTISALLLEVVDTNDPVRVGEATTYEIVVRNQGSGPARNVTIRASLPPEMEFVDASGATPIRVEDRTLVFAPVATLRAGQEVRWRVNARALGDGPVQFQLEMKSDEMDTPARESEPTRLYR